MAREIQAQPSRPPVLRRVAAGLVLLAVAALAVHLIIGLVMAVFWFAVVLAAIVAVIWALNQLL